jgi:PKD repeat protein
MASIDYFKGQLYLFASSRFGFEEVFSPHMIALDFGNSSTSTMTLTTDMNSEPGNYNVTVTALGATSTGASVTHIVVLTVIITQGPSSNTILGFTPLTYLGAIGALSLAVILLAAREVRRLKHARL